MYEVVPLLEIIKHLDRENPRLLQEWSMRNKAVRALLDEINTNAQEEVQSIDIQVDLSCIEAARNGVYKIEWETTLDERTVDSYFKQKKFKAIDRNKTEVEVIGISKTIEINKYQIYIKEKRT